MGIEEGLPGKFKAFNQLADTEIKDITHTHACIAGGLALIPIPGLSIPCVLGNLKFSENIVKSVGGMIASNLTVYAGGLIAAQAVKFIPFLGAALDAVTEGGINYAVTTTSGSIYCKWLKTMCDQGAIAEDGSVSAEKVKEVMEEVCANTDIKQMVSDAKQEAKNVNFKKYKGEAKIEK